ncbi:RNA helicase [Glutamicibacter sp. AGC46]
MSTANNTNAPVSADLTPPGGPGLAPAGGGLPVAVPNGENMGFEPEFYSAQKTDIGYTTNEDTNENDVFAGQGPVCTRDSLGSRVSVSETDTSSAPTDTPVDYSAFDVPGADPSDDVEPFQVPSSPEHIEAARAFFEAEKAAETSGQVKRAQTLSRVFSVMQYANHPETGVPIYSQEQLENGLALLDDQYGSMWSAFIAHPLDRLVEVDEGSVDCRCIGLKGLHWHLVLLFKDDKRPKIRTVSNALQIPSARVRVPREVTAQEGGDEHKGSGAAPKAFFDFCEYLPHESRRADAIAGVHQTERTYLTDSTQDGNPGKYQYGRGRVVANFNFSTELDAHLASRVSAAEGGKSLITRKRKLRRAVMDGMPLDAAEVADRDAFADDLPRLQLLRSRFEQKQGALVAEGLGTAWHKSVLAICGPKGSGKGILADEVAAQTQALVALAGCDWPYVQPPGRNALEAVGDAKITHHDDARFDITPTYDETLRYTDNHRATEAYKRHTRSGQVVAPRLIMMSSTETPQSLGLTMKARKPSDVLAFNAQAMKQFPPVDIDEFLRRIGWAVEVSIPESVRLTGDDHQDYPMIRAEMLVSIRRVTVNAARRIEPVLNRQGEPLGEITTTHEMAPVAVVKGAQDAARFLAVSILMENNRDVIEQIPESELAAYLAQKAAIEVAATEESDRHRQASIAAAEEVARQNREVIEAQQRSKLAKLEAERRELELCTCSLRQSGLYARHSNECPALSDEERQRRAKDKQKMLDAKVERLRANGGLLVAGGAR